jgi:hypothetical protein
MSAPSSPAPRKAERRRGYLDEQAVLLRWMARYPGVPCSLTHGFNYRLWLNEQEDGFEWPDEIWEPWRQPGRQVLVHQRRAHQRAYRPKKCTYFF